MELKQLSTTEKALLDKLLIVPYGIETRYFPECNKKSVLLIVPYGIETIRIINSMSKVSCF